MFGWFKKKRGLSFVGKSAAQEVALRKYPRWPEGMRLAEYDDEVAVHAYVYRYWYWFMTDFERSCGDLGNRYLKALHAKSKGINIPDWNEIESEWKSNPAIRSALGDELASFRDLTSFSTRAYERILIAFQTGELIVNRCPCCGRVARTPRAKQCVWCPHDWH
jgi:hypothetical protein